MLDLACVAGGILVFLGKFFFFTFAPPPPPPPAHHFTNGPLFSLQVGEHPREGGTPP